MNGVLKGIGGLVLVVFLGCIGSAVLAAEDEYLFDTLKKPAYRAAWEAMFKGEERVDPWLAKWAKTYNGPTNPCKSVNIDGIGYTVHSVCKPHECGDNVFIVLFAPEGRQAWGALFTSSQRFFGNPDPKKKEALVKSRNCD